MLSASLKHCQLVSPRTMGDKLRGHGNQHIPPFSALDFCCNCQQGGGIANTGGAGFCGGNGPGLQAGPTERSCLVFASERLQRARAFNCSQPG